MTRISSRLVRLVALVLALAVFGSACGGSDDEGAAEDTTEAGGEEQPQPSVPTGPETPAAQLRSSVHGLLQEHVVLASAATGAAVGGREGEFEAAAEALGQNSDALAATMKAVLGEQDGTVFDGLWKRHIELLVSYARGGGQQALTQLAASATELGAFVNSVLPALPADAVTQLVQTHVTNVKNVVDAQRGGDQTAAYTALRAAAEHTGNIAEPLIAAMTVKYPDSVSGDPKSPAATLVTALNSALREHVYLASAATGAALGSRQDEFTAAATALTGNSDDIAALIGSVYGADAGRAFDPLWKKHITFFVEYTTGIAGDDNAKRDKAVTDLLAYSKDFGAFINSASKELPKETVAELVKTHALTLKDVIDAQAAGDYAKAYTAERTAADHMKMIATPLATAIVAQFPDRF